MDVVTWECDRCLGVFTMAQGQHQHTHHCGEPTARALADAVAKRVIAALDARAKSPPGGGVKVGNPLQVERQLFGGGEASAAADRERKSITLFVREYGTEGGAVGLTWEEARWLGNQLKAMTHPEGS